MDAGAPRVKERSVGMETPPRRLVLRRPNGASHWWHPRLSVVGESATGRLGADRRARPEPQAHARAGAPP